MRRAAAAASIVAAVVVIYGKSTAGFFFDDDFHWLEQTQSFAPVHLFDLSRYDHFYRPVIEIYFAAGLAVCGCEPFGFHLASLAIHLLTIGAVFLLARALAQSAGVAYLSALLFAVQPGLTDAVTWIAAITDQLPVLWYVLTVWLHMRFLVDGRAVTYGAALCAFAVCHLTHESAATLLPMMVLTEFTFAAAGSFRRRAVSVSRHVGRYLPFLLVLAAFLATAWTVNSRSYLVQDGHYRLGWHALPNILDYIVWLYVGQRAVLDYLATIGVLASTLMWGSPRMRFSVLWIVVTLLPVSLFTWDNAARYLYLPAVGFSMLAADLLDALQRVLARRWSPGAARAVALAVTVVVVARFGIFARKAADSFPARAASYERFVEALRAANPAAAAGEVVTVERRHLEGVPELYRQPAARVGLCLPGVRLELR